MMGACTADTPLEPTILSPLVISCDLFVLSGECMHGVKRSERICKNTTQVAKLLEKAIPDHVFHFYARIVGSL